MIGLSLRVFFCLLSAAPTQRWKMKWRLWLMQLLRHWLKERPNYHCPDWALSGLRACHTLIKVEKWWKRVSLSCMCVGLGQRRCFDMWVWKKIKNNGLSFWPSHFRIFLHQKTRIKAKSSDSVSLQDVLSASFLLCLNNNDDNNIFFWRNPFRHSYLDLCVFIDFHLIFLESSISAATSTLASLSL